MSLISIHKHKISNFYYKIYKINITTEGMDKIKNKKKGRMKEMDRMKKTVSDYQLFHKSICLFEILVSELRA